MDNYKKISVKSFKRNSKRFGKLAKNYLNSIYADDVAVIDRLGNVFDYHVDDILNKMLETYKMSPNKRKSAYIHKIKQFSNIDGFLREFRLSYEFIDDKLVFKLLTRYHWKYKRKVKFVLPLNN